MGIIVFDADVRVIFANSLAAQLFGKPENTLQGLTCGDFVHCAHRHASPKGCGHTQNCTSCPLVRAICTTLACKGDPLNAGILEGEALLTRGAGLSAIWLKYKVNGIILEGRNAAVMAIDDITESKHNEEKLGNALAELSVIHEHAPIAMMLMDQDRKVRKVNGFAAKFAQRRASEMIGMTGGEALRCLHHFDDPHGCGFGPACADCRVRQAVLDTFATQISQPDIEAWLPFPRGASHIERCLLISTAYLKTDLVERVLVCAQDITDRKQAEAALRESEARFRRMFMNAPMPYQSLDAQGNFIDVNQTLLDLLGYAREELIGRNFGELLHPDWVDHFKENFPRFKSVGEIVGVEFEMVKKDGDCLLVHLNEKIQLDDQGRFEQTHCIFQDITERNRAEAVLREREKSLVEAQDIAKLGRWELDLKTGHLSWSDRIFDFFEIDRDRFSAAYDAFLSFVHPDDRDLVNQNYRTSVENKTPYKTEHRLLMADGRVKWVAEIGRTEYDASGHPVRSIGTIQEITERKEAENERKIVIDLLSRLNRSNSLQALIHQTAELLREWTGCEAIGIRLQEKDDFPYYETNGFPADFVACENRLCEIDPQGEWIREHDGNAVLACMCGNVIRGRFDPALPFFTANGSFWTNSTTDLLASTSEAERQARTRNRCNGEGYESVALIPLRHGDRNIGLLQINDFRRGCFDEAKITLLERLAASLTIGITQRRAAEALTHSEERLRTIADFTYDWEYWLGPDHHLLWVSPSCHRISGYTPAEFLQDDGLIERIIHTADLFRYREHLEKAHGGAKHAHQMDFRIIHKSGRTVWIDHHCIAIQRPDGTVLGQRVSNRDITDRKRLETRLQQAQKMEAIGALAGGIAHDFNNILFPISGMAEMLLEDFSTGSHHHEHIILIHEAAVRAKELVKQILRFSRQAEHQKIPLCLHPVLKEVCKLARATIPANITFGQNIRTDCGPVLADPTHVHQIAMNLITNAFHAVEQNGGQITIELQQVVLSRHDIKGTSLRPGSYALLTVSDNGHGIPAELLSKIFNPYFTTKPQDKGTGLGLSVVYGIVKAHDGDIRVYSEVGQGTTFKVYLPVIARPVAVETSKINPVHATGTERILLVDDEDAIVRMEKKMLQRLGYRITAHTSSGQALEAFKADPAAYDLIITDMAMPGMTGDQLARHLIAIRADIPVILCTGFSEKLFATDGATSFIKGFLMKPVAKADLTQMVRKVLDESVKRVSP